MSRKKFEKQKSIRSMSKAESKGESLQAGNAYTGQDVIIKFSDPKNTRRKTKVKFFFR